MAVFPVTLKGIQDQRTRALLEALQHVADRGCSGDLFDTDPCRPSTGRPCPPCIALAALNEFLKCEVCQGQGAEKCIQRWVPGVLRNEGHGSPIQLPKLSSAAIRLLQALSVTPPVAIRRSPALRELISAELVAAIGKPIVLERGRRVLEALGSWLPTGDSDGRILDDPEPIAGISIGPDQDGVGGTGKTKFDGLPQEGGP